MASLFTIPIKIWPHDHLLCSSKVHSNISLLSRSGSEVIYFLQVFRQKYLSCLHSTAACMRRILNVNTLIPCCSATLPLNIHRRSATNYGINTQKYWHFLNMAKNSKYSWKDKNKALIWYTSMYKLFINKFSWQNLAVILLRSPLSTFLALKNFHSRVFSERDKLFHGLVYGRQFAKHCPNNTGRKVLVMKVLIM